MDTKTFDYLYNKAQGDSAESIMKELEITAEEYAQMEQKLAPVLAEIMKERAQAEKIGERFVQLTNYLYMGKSDQEKGMHRPPAIKPRTGDQIALPAVATIPLPEITLHQAISQRRSLRKYSDAPLSQEELSFLLWSCSWARDFRSSERLEITLRNVPSAGARHPLETYLYIRRVTGIKPGLYYYHPVKHLLVLVMNGPEIERKIVEGCFCQEMTSASAVNFIWTAVPYRTIWRYDQRSYRYMYLDAGHAAQNLHLAAEAIDGGACMIGAYCDEMMSEALDLDGTEEFVIYIATVGKKEPVNTVH